MKLGILGGGQLARMLALSGHALGIQTVCYDNSSEACAKDVTDVIHAPFTDKEALTRFAAEVDCITIETENIPLDCAEFLSQKKPFFPSVEALKLSQDRWLEKEYLTSLGIPVAPYARVDSMDDLNAAMRALNTPAVLKTRRMGYDGKGQYDLASEHDVPQAWEAIGAEALILEQRIPFERELSLIVVKGSTGAFCAYPLIENTHAKGILRYSEAPYVDDPLQAQAEHYAQLILNALDYRGVLTIEYFCYQNQLLVNELAPRVHNSGHLTMEASHTSQFENHLRALFSLPLGCCDFVSKGLMVNALGQMPDRAAVFNIPCVHYHDYRKLPKPLRKVGHLTLADAHEARYQHSRAQLLRYAQTYCPAAKPEDHAH